MKSQNKVIITIIDDFFLVELYRDGILEDEQSRNTMLEARQFASEHFGCNNFTVEVI